MDPDRTFGLPSAGFLERCLKRLERRLSFGGHGFPFRDFDHCAPALLPGAKEEEAPSALPYFGASCLDFWRFRFPRFKPFSIDLLHRLTTDFLVPTWIHPAVLARRCPQSRRYPIGFSANLTKRRRR